jgi:hypothetical protein
MVYCLYSFTLSVECLFDRVVVDIPKPIEIVFAFTACAFWFSL